MFFYHRDEEIVIPMLCLYSNITIITEICLNNPVQLCSSRTEQWNTDILTYNKTIQKCHSDLRLSDYSLNKSLLLPRLPTLGSWYEGNDLCMWDQLCRPRLAHTMHRCSVSTPLHQHCHRVTDICESGTCLYVIL